LFCLFRIFYCFSHELFISWVSSFIVKKRFLHKYVYFYFYFTGHAYDKEWEDSVFHFSLPVTCEEMYIQNAWITSDDPTNMGKRLTLNVTSTHGQRYSIILKRIRLLIGPNDIVCYDTHSRLLWDQTLFKLLLQKICRYFKCEDGYWKLALDVPLIMNYLVNLFLY